MKKAIIAGVGALNGLGSELSHRFAQENLDVTVVGRTEEKIVKVCESIKNFGLSANPYVCDVTNENEVKKLFDLFNSDLDLVVYNAGNNMPEKLLKWILLTLRIAGEYVVMAHSFFQNMLF